MRVLLIGGTGFVGGAVARRLLEGGHAVAAFHRGEISGGAGTIRGDRRELSRHREAFRRFAPEVALDTIAYTEEEGRAFALAFRGLASRLVVLSSQDVYAPYGRLLRLEGGERETAASDEDSPLRASRYPYRAASRPGEMGYAYDKILVESAVLGEADVPVTILRLPKVYGPKDPRRQLRGLVERMSGSGQIEIDRAKAGWRWTRGYVEDVAEAIALAATDARAAGRVYNLGEAEAPTEAEWVRAVGEAAGWRGKLREVPRDELSEGLAEPYDFSHDLVCDTRRLREQLGFRERVGRAEGLRKAVEWELRRA